MQVTRISKSQRIKEIQYIFVVFKHCETRSTVLDVYKEAQPVNCLDSCFPSSKKDKKQHLLFGRKVDIEGILEPDEIIWENLAFTGDE